MNGVKPRSMVVSLKKTPKNELRQAPSYKINIIYRPFLLENHIQNRALSKFHVNPIFLLVSYLNTQPETMGVVRNGLFPPPVGLYPPFQRDAPARHIMGDAGCALLG